jgi:hypothetical protein
MRTTAVAALAAVAVVAAGCGSSVGTRGKAAPASSATPPIGTNVGTQRLDAAAAQCDNARNGYRTLAADLGRAAGSTGPAGFAAPVADTAKLSADIQALRPRATTAQQTQVDRYTTRLSELGAALQQAAAANGTTTDPRIARVAPRINPLPSLVESICANAIKPTG